MVDALSSGGSERMLVRVQLPPLARTNRSFGSGFLFSGDFPGLNNKMWGYGSIPIPEKHAKQLAEQFTTAPRARISCQLIRRKIDVISQKRIP